MADNVGIIKRASNFVRGIGGKTVIGKTAAWTAIGAGVATLLGTTWLATRSGKQHVEPTDQITTQDLEQMHTAQQMQAAQLQQQQQAAIDPITGSTPRVEGQHVAQVMGGRGGPQQGMAPPSFTQGNYSDAVQQGAGANTGINA